MHFIDRVVGPDETLIGIVKAHWIYGVFGLFWYALPYLTVCLFQWGIERFAPPVAQRAIYLALGPLGEYAYWTLLVVGVILGTIYVTKMIDTEIGVTSRRVVYKRGLIFVNVTQLDLDEVKAADIDNGVFGRFLNYGYLLLDARFVENLRLPAIENPYRFLKALNEARTRLKKDNLNVILEGDAVPEQVEIAGQSKTYRKKFDRQHYDLHDPRYSSVSDTPARNLLDVAREAGTLAREQARHYIRQEIQPLRQPRRAPPAYKPRDEEALKERVMESFEGSAHYGQKD